MDTKSLVEPKVNPSIPQLSPGDTVKVKMKVKEGGKEWTQQFQGTVIGLKKGVDGGSFTVRRVSYGVGVECTFPFQSPLLRSVEVLKHSKVRRAKLYYIRRLSAKQARLEERREKLPEQEPEPEPEPEP
jgi:large subunit ribosomal protein L19